jgi:LPS sulfotransferase NodH
MTVPPAPTWGQLLQLSARITAIPSMISGQETSFLYSYMRDHYQGQGEAVELGSFLGASTAAQAAGLIANPLPATQSRRLFSYDSFIWGGLINWWKHKPRHIGELSPPILQPEDRFEDSYRINVQPWLDRIEVRAGWVNETSWDGAPIEWLFVDIMKSQDTAAVVARTFFPHLLPQVGVLYHQDYKFLDTPWIHMLMYRLRNYFKPWYSVEHGGMVFTCLYPIPMDAIEEAVAFHTYTVHEINNSFAYSLALMGNDVDYQRGYVMISHLDAYLEAIEQTPPETRRTAIQDPLFQARLRQLFVELPAKVPATPLLDAKPNTKSSETTPPTTCYVLCGTPGSGIKWGSEFIQAQGIMGAPQAFLDPAVQTHLRQAWSLQDAPMLDYLRACMQHTISSLGIFGITLTFDHLQAILGELNTNSTQPDAFSTLETLFPNLHCVYLTRSDRIQQALGNLVDRQASEYDVAEIDAEVKSLIQQHIAWSRFFMHCPKPPQIFDIHDLYTIIQPQFHSMLNAMRIEPLADWRFQLVPAPMLPRHPEWGLRYLMDKGVTLADSVVSASDHPES